MATQKRPPQRTFDTAVLEKRGNSSAPAQQVGVNRAATTSASKAAARRATPEHLSGRAWFYLAAAAVCLSGTFLLVYEDMTEATPKLEKLVKEREKLQAKNKSLTEWNKEQEAFRLRLDDPEFFVRVARQNLSTARPDEVYATPGEIILTLEH